MAKLKEQSEGTQRGSISNFMGDEEVSDVSGSGGEQREDSPSRITEIEPEGICLEYPNEASPVWPNFMNILTEVQHALAKSKNLETEKLRIVKATVPATALPSDYDTGHGGIRIEQGDEFFALLSDGRVLTAEKA